MAKQTKPEAPAPRVELVDDAFDKLNFGSPLPTITKTFYGPDPLLVNCPQMAQRIQDIGLEAYANATAETILLKEERAVEDPFMRHALRGAIQKFGVQSVAEAFRRRIMRIPSRMVEVEVDRDFDMRRAPDQAMIDVVQRYCPAGMAPKFLSERCMNVLGRRGYEIVKDENGDPVRVATLILGIMPQEMADNERRRWQEDAIGKIQGLEEEFADGVSRVRHEADRLGLGVSVLRGEDVVAQGRSAGDFGEFYERDDEVSRRATLEVTRG
jgi:hypothetical protein